FGRFFLFDAAPSHRHLWAGSPLHGAVNQQRWVEGRRTVIAGFTAAEVLKIPMFLYHSGALCIRNPYSDPLSVSHKTT
ncbi:MAG: hypothetical protein RRY95_05300, partial [Oscillospiraceae bacterium]